jgi:endonuclease-8
VLVGKTVRALLLQRRVERTDGIVGKKIEGVEARGKNLLVHFEGGFSLHVHLKMWGRIFLRPLAETSQTGTSADTVVVLDTDRDRVLVVKAPVARLIRTRDLARDVHFRNLGPDLLAPTFDAAEALRRLASRKEVPLGEALADQSAVAGIGNVWKSELCFNLKLDPFAPVSACTEDELSRLLDLAREQMKETVERKPRKVPDPFTPRGNTRAPRQGRRHGQKPVSVYGREGEACYDCGARIRMRRQGELNRSTYFCPGCQPARSSA